MLRVVLLAALLLTVAVVALPEASANNICQDGIVADHLAGGCSPVGIVCRDVLPIIGATC